MNFRLVLLLICILTASTTYFQTVNGEDVLEDAILESDDKVSSEDPIENSQQDENRNSALTDQETTADEFPDGLPKPHASIEAKLLFVDPSHLGVVPRPSSIVPLEVPVSHPVRVALAVRHLGLETAQKTAFIFDAVTACLRYPMDYSYYIQNFSASRLHQLQLEPHHETSLVYSFNPAAQLTGRPYGLTVRLYYRDSQQVSYVTTVMNETVTLVDYEPPLGAHRGLDSEGMFLYAVIVGVGLLLLLGVFQLWQSYAPRKVRQVAAKQFTAAAGGILGGAGGMAGHLGGAANVRKTAASGGKDYQSDGGLSPGRGGHGSGSKTDAENELLLAASNSAREKGVDVTWIPKDVLLRDAANKKSPARQNVKNRKAAKEALEDSS